MPLELLETTDPLASLLRFETSPVFETIISLQLVTKPGARAEWAAALRAGLPADLLDEVAAVYEPFFNGAVFFELAVDYPDHEDVPGFVHYVRTMDPVLFVWYVVGRILTPQQIAQTHLDADALRTALKTTPFDVDCWCSQAPLERILDDVPAFQRRLANLWERYWREYFSARLDQMRPRWERALDDKRALLARLGGQSLLEHLTGRPQLPPPLPPEYPFTEIVIIPLALLNRPVLMFYGYGKVTIVFDSERTQERLAEIQQHKEQVVNLLKALGDSSRLEILRLIAQHGDEMNGKRIAAKLNLSAPTVSRHLAQLRDAGLLVEETSDNRTITYRLQQDVLTSLPALVMDYLFH